MSRFFVTLVTLLVCAPTLGSIIAQKYEPAPIYGSYHEDGESVFSLGGAAYTTSRLTDVFENWVWIRVSEPGWQMVTWEGGSYGLADVQVNIYGTTDTSDSYQADPLGGHWVETTLVDARDGDFYFAWTATARPNPTDFYKLSSIAVSRISWERATADFNLDGAVDAADYTVWRDKGLSADEYELWKSEFGGWLHPEAIPEPGCPLLLSVFAVCWWSGWRRRGASSGRRSRWASIIARCSAGCGIMACARGAVVCALLLIARPLQAAISLTYVTTVEDTRNAATYDFGNVNFPGDGTAVIAVVSRIAGTASINSVSVGGNAATIQHHNNPAATAMAIATRPVSAGNHNVTVAFSGSMSRAIIGCYLLIGHHSDVPSDTCLMVSDDYDLTFPADGAAVYAFYNSGVTSPTTWGAATEDYDAATEASSRVSYAHKTASGVNTETVTTGGTDGIAVVWAPAGGGGGASGAAYYYQQQSSARQRDYEKFMAAIGLGQLNLAIAP